MIDSSVSELIPESNTKPEVKSSALELPIVVALGEAKVSEIVRETLSPAISTWETTELTMDISVGELTPEEKTKLEVDGSLLEPRIELANPREAKDSEVV